MNTTTKKKLCWNCEGDVDRDAKNCPYCGVYLHPEDDEVEEQKTYSPPYVPEEGVERAEALPQPPYRLETEEEAEEQLLIQEQANWKPIFIPSLLLASGILLFFFGLLIGLFSNEGYLTLRWSASYWYLYLLISTPLLYFGWRYLQEVPED